MYHVSEYVGGLAYPDRTLYPGDSEAANSFFPGVREAQRPVTYQPSLGNAFHDHVPLQASLHNQVPSYKGAFVLCVGPVPSGTIIHGGTIVSVNPPESTTIRRYNNLAIEDTTCAKVEMQDVRETLLRLPGAKFPLTKGVSGSLFTIRDMQPEEFNFYVLGNDPILTQVWQAMQADPARRKLPVPAVFYNNGGEVVPLVPSHANPTAANRTIQMLIRAFGLQGFTRIATPDHPGHDGNILEAQAIECYPDAVTEVRDHWVGCARGPETLHYFVLHAMYDGHVSPNILDTAMRAGYMKNLPQNTSSDEVLALYVEALYNIAANGWRITPFAHVRWAHPAEWPEAQRVFSPGGLPWAVAYVGRTATGYRKGGEENAPPYNTDGVSFFPPDTETSAYTPVPKPIYTEPTNSQGANGPNNLVLGKHGMMPTPTFELY